MNKLFTKIAALALGATMALGVGVAVASTGKEPSRADAAAVVYKEVSFTAAHQDSSVTGYTASWTATQDGFTVTLENFNNNANKWDYVKCGRKNNASVANIISPSIDQAIVKVSITIDAITASVSVDNSIKLYTSSDNSTWSEAGSFTKATGSQSVTLSSPSANLYYKAEFDCASHTSNGPVQVSKIEYYRNEGGSVTPLTTPSPVYNKTNNRVEWTATADAHADHYEISLDNGENWNSATASSYQDVSSYASSSAYTMQVKAVAPAGSTTYEDSDIGSVKFAKLVHAGTQADPYTIADARAAIDAQDGVTGVYVAGIVSAIPTPYDSGHSNITFDIVDTKGDSDFIRAYRCGGTDAANVRLNDEAVVSGNLTKYNDLYEFSQGCTLTSLVHPIVPSVDFVKNYGRVLVGQTKTYEAVAENIGDASLTYSSGTTAKATVDSSSGAVTGVALGDSVITASATVSGTSYSDTYTLHVVAPFSVAEAVTFINAGSELEDNYVTGYISSKESLSNGTITYNISDDGSTTSQQFEVYKGKGIDGADFESDDELSLGDLVVVYGNLQKYNSTYEFASGNYLISKESQEPYSITVTVTNGTFSGDTTIGRLPSSTASVTIAPNSGYKLPATVSVSGATPSYDSSTGVISLSSATGNVTINATCATAEVYSITVTQSHCTHTGATSITEGQEATLTFTADSGYVLPSTVTPTGASVKSWNNITGVLVLENATGPVTLSVVATENTYINTSSLNPGTYLIKIANKYFTGTVTSGVGELDANKPGDAGKFAFSLIGNDTWSIINLNGDRLGITGTSSKNLTIGDNSYTFKIIDGETTGTYKINSLDYSARYVSCYNGGDLRTYALNQSGGTYDFTLETAKSVSSFSVNTEGANKNVLKGSTFDAAAAQAAGFQARLNYSDSTYDDVTLAATWTLDTGTVGTATLTVTYESYTAVTINDMNIYTVTIVSLSIDTTNAKTSGYWTGDQLVTDGLIITGYDSSDNEYSIAIGDCTFSPTTLNTAGNSITITVSYTNESGTPAVATGTYTVSVSQFAYSKSTSINGGDRILFVGFKSDLSEYRYLSSIGALSSNTGGIATVYTDKPGTENYYDVVAGVNDGTVAFKNSEGKYLNGATVKNLSLSNDITADTSWTVSFTDDVPTIANVSVPANIIKYNASSPRFVTYANDSAIQMNVWKLNGTSGQADAEDFASEFIADVVNDVCKAFGPTFNDDMETMWALYAESYAALSSEAKAYIASKSASASGDDVEKMLYEYKHIYETYGDELNISNFLGRIEVSKAPLAPRTPIVNIVGENGNAITIVVIVSVISLTAIGGYFFLRKRREQN